MQYDIIMGRGTSVFSIPASENRHKIYRKLLHGSLNGRAIQTYHSMLEGEGQILLKRLLASPENFTVSVHKYVASMPADDH